MLVKVTQLAYLDDALRNAGDVFEWTNAGDVLPPCVEAAVNETETAADEPKPAAKAKKTNG